jgi:hypothetical protein
MMSETLEENSGSLSKLTDVVFNIRSSVIRLEALNQNVEALKSEVVGLKKSFQGLKPVKSPSKRFNGKRQSAQNRDKKTPSL